MHRSWHTARTRVVAAVAAALLLSGVGVGTALPAWATTSSVASAGDLAAAFADSAVDRIELAGDITVSGSLSTGRDLTLDLAGHGLNLVNLTVSPGTRLVIEDSLGGGRLTANTTGVVTGRAGITTTGATLEVHGGTITATAWIGAAGIGGDSTGRAGGHYLQSGGSVTAIAGSFGAGVGGSGIDYSTPGGSGGTIEVSGGTLEARGGAYAAGIGGGSVAPAGSVEISGGVVTATGGQNGPGIGNGYGSARTSDDGSAVVAITGGAVTANGGLYGGPGVGGAYAASGVDLDVASGATLTVSDTQGYQPLGYGYGNPANWWGDYDIAGTLVLANNLQLPAGTTLDVAAGGVVEGPGGFRQNFAGAWGGTVVNDGAIRTTVDNWTRVTGHDYRVTFAPNRAGATPATGPTLRVLAPTFAAAGFTMPTLPTASGALAWGWNTAADGSGTEFDATTAIPGTLTVYADWRPFTHLTVTADDPDILAGGQAVIHVVGHEPISGLTSDQTAFATYASSEPTDVVAGNLVTMTRAGGRTVTASVGGVEGDVSVSVSAGALDHLVVTPTVGGSPLGADAVVAAGTEVVLEIEGFDVYGNSLGDLAADATITWTAFEPTTGATFVPYAAGRRIVIATIDGISATVALDVEPGPLESVTIDMPWTWTAGAAVDVVITGRDAYGNDRGQLDRGEFQVHSTVTSDDVDADSPVAYVAGERSIGVEVDAISMIYQYVVAVVPGDVARLEVGGASFIGAGGWARFSAIGYDAWDNEITGLTGRTSFTTDSPGAAVDDEWIEFFRAGPATITGVFDDDPSITAEWPVEIMPGPLAVITVTAVDDEIEAGGTVAFDYAGTDAYGNPVSVCGCGFVLSTPESTDVIVDDEITFEVAGVRRVTATLPGYGSDPDLTATVDVTVTPAAPVDITLTASAARVDQGRSLTFAVSGVDEFGNPISSVPGVTLESDQPTDVIDGLTVHFPHASPHVITARLGSLSASVTVQVTPRPGLPNTGGEFPVAVLVAGTLLLAAGVGVVRRVRQPRTR